MSGASQRPDRAWQLGDPPPSVPETMIDEKDRLAALRMALDLHKMGQGVSRTADAVIITANRFLQFVHDPEKAIKASSVHVHARRAVAVMYKVANSGHVLSTDKAELVATAKLLGDALSLKPDEVEGER